LPKGDCSTLPDDARRADTRAWLSKARTDLRSAEHALGASPPLLEDAAFHSQQAAEKAMKALLAWHDEPFRKTHSLEEVGRQCAAIYPDLAAVVDEAAPLTEYAWKFRYPGDPAPPTRAEVEQALRIARAVFAAVLGKLPAEARA